MNLLILGLVLFLATHLVPSYPRLRKLFVARYNPTGYKAIFNILSLISIVLIIYGLKESAFQPLYDPPSWGHHLAMLLMLPAIYFFLSNSVRPTPSSAQFITAHPVNWAVILWSTSHLLANGDLAHVLLFSTFWLFSVISIVTGNSRGLKPILDRRPSLSSEAIFVVIVIIVYCTLIWSHQYFTGMSLFGI
ncbi:MAG: NnrU family protein [Methylococcaceae bacterium]